jgi:hypothetical protein
MFKFNKIVSQTIPKYAKSNFSIFNSLKNMISPQAKRVDTEAHNYVKGLEQFRIRHDVNSNTKIVKYDTEKKHIYYSIKISPHQEFFVYDYYSPTSESIKLASDISVLSNNELSKEEIIKHLNNENTSDEMKFMLIMLLIKVESNNKLIQLFKDDKDSSNNTITLERYCSVKMTNDRKLVMIRRHLNQSKELDIIYEKLKHIDIERYNRDSVRLFKIVSMMHSLDTLLWRRLINNFSNKLDKFVDNSIDKRNYLPFLHLEIVDVFINIFDFLYYNKDVIGVKNDKLDFYSDLRELYKKYFNFLSDLFQTTFGNFSGALVKFLSVATLLDLKKELDQDKLNKFQDFIMLLMIKDLKFPVFLLKTLELYQIYYRDYQGDRNELKEFKYFDEEFEKLVPYSSYIKEYIRSREKMDQNERKKLEEETDPKLLETEMLILETFNNTVFPKRFINKVLNHITNNDFNFYEDYIFNFVILVKHKYNYSYKQFDSKFHDFIVSKMFLIKQDIRLLFRCFILATVDKDLPNLLSNSLKQYARDGIKNYKNEKHIISEMKKEIDFLIEKTNIKNDEIDEIVNQLNNYLNI